MHFKKSMRLVSIRLFATLAILLFFSSPAVARSVFDIASKPSLTVLDSYHKALEETLKQWPESTGQTPATLNRASNDLLSRLEQLIRQLEISAAEGRDRKSTRIHQQLLAFYEAHHEVTRNAFESQILAYEQREEERDQAKSRRDQPADEKEEKKDIEKVFDAIFGSRSEKSTPSEESSPEKTKQPPLKPVANYKRPLLVEQHIVDGVTAEVQFLMELNESDSTTQRATLWLNHTELLLGTYLKAVLGKSSIAPLLANQYEQHLKALRDAWNKKTGTFGRELRTPLQRSLKHQEQILGGIPYSRSSRAHDLESRVGQFLQALS